MKSTRPLCIALIGQSPGHVEFVEFDGGGEYFRRDFMAVAAPDFFADSFDRAEAAGVNGISVRVERYGRNVFNHPNFINVYYLIGRATGRFTNAEHAWKAFTTEYYGEDIAAEMEAILRPTGEVFAESVHIYDDIFGNSARDYLGGWTGEPRISTPFAWSCSPRNWGRKLFPDYDESHLQAIDRGDPSVIADETAAYERELKSIDGSLARLDALRQPLGEDGWRFHRWLLEETRFHLILMQEATLAWLHAKQLSGGNSPDPAATTATLDYHLDRIRALLPRTTETIDVHWRERHHVAKRGEYYDIPRLLKDFADWRAGFPPAMQATSSFRAPLPQLREQAAVELGQPVDLDGDGLQELVPTSGTQSPDDIVDADGRVLAFLPPGSRVAHASHILDNCAGEQLVAYQPDGTVIIWGVAAEPGAPIPARYDEPFYQRNRKLTVVGYNAYTLSGLR